MDLGVNRLELLGYFHTKNYIKANRVAEIDVYYTLYTRISISNQSGRKKSSDLFIRLSFLFKLTFRMGYFDYDDRNEDIPQFYLTRLAIK